MCCGNANYAQLQALSRSPMAEQMRQQQDRPLPDGLFAFLASGTAHRRLKRCHSSNCNSPLRAGSVFCRHCGLAQGEVPARRCEWRDCRRAATGSVSFRYTADRERERAFLCPMHLLAARAMMDAGYDLPVMQQTSFRGRG